MSALIVFNPVVPAVIGGMAGAIAGGVNRGDDGRTGLQDREVGESLRRTGYVAATLGLLNGLRFGAAGLILGGIGGAVLGASYQFTKNAID